MSTNQTLALPYTIGFCIAGDTVLMLHRNFPPNQHLWNGIGGRIEPGESPDDAIARELMEEAALDSRQALSVKYVGIVTWTHVQDSTNSHKGMYAYIIEYASG
jgi:8-oxo-dGTP diphosphatase